MIATKIAIADKFVRGLRLDFQDFIRALKPNTQANALHLAVDMSLHERVDPFKTSEKGSTSGKKRKDGL